MRHKVEWGAAVSLLIAVGIGGAQRATQPGDAMAQGPALQVAERARRLHQRAIVVDTHDDTTQRLLFDKSFDFSRRSAEGHVDLPRAREGGLDAIFFSIWMPSDYTGPKAVKRSLDLIDAVQQTVRRNAGSMVLATTAQEVRQAHQQGKIAALLGMEGGHMIDDDLGVLRNYAALGVRYLTLSHFKNNNWADSSTDTPRHNGLTAFGKDVVREMNRLGVMVDISHVSDKTFYDALEVTRAPVMASHSSAYAISDHPRNMKDDMLRAVAKNGGVVHINYHVDFLSQEYSNATRAAGQDVTALGLESEKQCGENQACQILEDDRRYRQQVASGKRPQVSWEKIIEHIDHVARIAGVDHVGLGSDFDGANMPVGMDDARFLPRLTDALLKKGYSEKDVEKILGGNTLRVMEQVERVAREMAQAKK
jgi:membrane dipeptidase